MSRGGHTRWQSGQSGNPSGRRKGTVLAMTKIKQMIEEAGPEIVEKQIAIAKRGNPIVARFLLEKILPAARSAPIAAPVELEGTAAEKAERIVDLMSAGSLTLEEGAAMMSALASLQTIRDASEIGERLAEIESRLTALTSA